MIVYIVLTIFTCVIATMARSQFDLVATKQNILDRRAVTMDRLRSFLVCTMIFLSLFAVSACRIAIGHDYWEYTGIFSLIAQNRHVSTEFGFNWLVKGCHFLFGTQNYIIIFAIFAFVTIAFFIRAIYEQADIFGISFFLFMMFGYYLSSMNSIRYYLVLSIAVFATGFLIKKEYAKFVICILVAACFHKAVLFVLLAYPLAKLKWNKLTVFFTTVFTVSLLVIPGFYRKIIFMIYPFYENSLYDTNETSVINILRCAAVLLFALCFYKKALKDNEKNMLYFNLNVEALIVYSCCSFIPVVSRIGFFLNIFQIFLIPGVIKSMDKKWQKYLFGALTVVAGILYYALFLRACKDDGTRLVPYLNWILN